MLEKLHDILIYWDYTAWYYLNTQWTNSFLDAVVPFLRNKWTWAPVYLFLFIFMPLNYGRKGWMWCVFFLLTFAFSDYISASLVKPVYLRLRPCNNPYIKDVVHLLVPCGSGYSFPSSHAANHFGLSMFMAGTIGRQYGWIKILVFAWAFSVAYAQVYVGVHFPGDVLAGAALGILAGLLTAFVYNKVYRKKQPKVSGTSQTL